MKKILLLGGSSQQIPAIQAAKKRGLITILCDYLEDNPGQHFADKFFLISTTDPEAVLGIAKAEEIDYVMAYASDPAAPTAAYVAEQLGLPGNPFEAVSILCNKERFRDFQRAHGFAAPEGCGYGDVEEALRDIKNNRFRFPVIAKPTDSSGSKGVGRIDGIAEAEEKLKTAFRFSREGRIVVEEAVGTYGRQLMGDGLSADGRLVFTCFADHHFDLAGENPFVPAAGAFPADLSGEMLDRINAEIQRLLSLLHMKTAAYNFEVRIGDQDQIYLMEAAPRNGGNYIPEVIRECCGTDLVDCAVRAAMGEDLSSVPFGKPKGYASYYVVHSPKAGILDHIEIDPFVREGNLLQEHFVKFPGDHVEAFTAANTTLGILVMKFDSREEMTHMMDHPEEWIRVIVK